MRWGWGWRGIKAHTFSPFCEMKNTDYSLQNTHAHAHTKKGLRCCQICCNILSPTDIVNQWRGRGRGWDAELQSASIHVREQGRKNYNRHPSCFMTLLKHVFIVTEVQAVGPCYSLSC